jgi:cytoskeletal protein CcmA (bactofilin family)
LNQAYDGGLINSIIGEGATFHGDIKVTGFVRVDGNLTGSITTNGKVVIGRNGRCESAIEGSSVIVGGVVKGDVTASEKVVILSSGMVIGNVTSPRLVADDGVMLNGFYMVSGARTGAKPVARDGPRGGKTAGTPADSGA